jgi:hypothetical protein
MHQVRFLFLFTIPFLLAACAGIKPTGSTSEAPTGLREWTWGAAPDAGLQASPITDAKGITVYLPREDNRATRFMGVPVAEERYTFADGKFFLGNLWIDGKDNHTHVLKQLQKRYGAPARTVGHYDRDTLADEKKSLTIWEWTNSPVEVRLSFSEQFKRTTVTFLNREMLAQYRKQHSEQAASDAAAHDAPAPAAVQ